MEGRKIREIGSVLAKIPRTGEKRPLSPEEQGLRDLFQLDKEARQVLSEYEELTKKQEG